MPVLPSATTTLTSMAAWSQPFFDSLWPYAMFAGGILLAIGFIMMVVRLAGHASDKMGGH
jgi:hypothetical protein